MDQIVAIPKLFLRGNKWYLRVQVPIAMQGNLKRREYWVSLKTSDRSVALERATDATRQKRLEIEAAFHRLSYADDVPDALVGDNIAPQGDAGQALGVDESEGAALSVAKSSSNRGRYDALSKAQLIELLERRDSTKKLGLVWEGNQIGVDRTVDQDFTLAEIDQSLSDKSAPWHNLVIEGDNYDALRWLRMTHRGRVKCIYIDPPYNTGNESWVYNDRFKNSDHRYNQSEWLDFLHRRLVLARDLLTEDGVILMSINDQQRAVAELVMSEALPGLRISSLVWRTRNGSNADQGAYLSPDHEHILVASKGGFSFVGIEKSFATYANVDDDPRGDWQAVPIKLSFSKDERPNLYYPLHDPNTNIYYPCNPDSVWRFATRQRVAKGQRLQTQPIEDFIKQGRILFPTDQRVETYETLKDLEAAIDRRDVPLSGGVPILRHDLPDLTFWVGKPIGFGTPKRKLFKSELRRPTKPLSSWISGYSEIGPDDSGDNQITAGSYTEGSREIRSIFGSKAFNHAKPVSLIRELIRQSTSANDLILDFFAGSATTAQSVIQLNAEDGGDRRFIMVSSTEATKDAPDKNLCRDVTAERVRLINGSDDKKYADLAAGFAYLRTTQIDQGGLDQELAPSVAWTSLEALHGLPLTPYDRDRPWNVHEGFATTLVLVDRYDVGLIEWLRPRSERKVYVYAWAQGPFSRHLHEMNIAVSNVIETLLKAKRA